VIDGAPVLLVTHYEDDDSWAFLDGQPINESDALVVAMQTVMTRHPTLTEVADLPPGWTATRAAVGAPWTREMD
jgi:diadenosine tetraphosphate (Ap4A) HIT family hydrolase